MFATHLSSVVPLASGGFDPTWQTVFLVVLVGVILMAAAWVMTQQKNISD